MPWPFKSYMGGRAQDREIRQAVDHLLDLKVTAGYGGMLSDNNPAYSLGGAWTKFTDFTALTLANPIGVTADLANNTLAFDQPGIWQVDLGFVFDHNESNQGRTFYYRFFDEGDQVPASPAFPIGVGRNTPVTNFFASLLVQIGGAEEVQPAEAVSIELGNGSSVTGNFAGFTWNAQRVSSILAS